MQSFDALVAGGVFGCASVTCKRRKRHWQDRSLYTKGWLPYTLRWQFRVTEAQKPLGFSLEASGDFQGRGIWKFEQDDKWVNVTCDWKIHADKPLLRSPSWLFKPIFSANHRWAMAKGEESLKLEIKRHHDPWQTISQKPPGPTFPHSLGYRKKWRQ
jgi:hypothetical protein